MINSLLLMSKHDIPFVEAQVSIHQPTINQIALLGQHVFDLGCNLLCISKEKLEKEEDKINLKNKTNFDILMSIIGQRRENNALNLNVEAVEMVLFLLFPQYKILFMPTMIVLQKTTEEGKQQHIINNNNYENFKQILVKMFCLEGVATPKFNPINKAAARIAKKLEERQSFLSKRKSSEAKSERFLRMVSILSLGNHNSVDELMNYTVFQLSYQMRRYERKYSYQIYLKAKMAGAQDLQDIQNWMEEEDERENPIPQSNKNIVEFD